MLRAQPRLESVLFSLGSCARPDDVHQLCISQFEVIADSNTLL